MRAVVDPNVIISALLSPRGTPAKVIQAWLAGAFELVASETLLAELRRATAYPKLRERIDREDVNELVELFHRSAQMLDDSETTLTIHSTDPGDDYLIALAEVARAAIVSGDGHLLALADHLPVYSPASFLSLLESNR